jgi:hypothetical protein
MHLASVPPRAGHDHVLAAGVSIPPVPALVRARQTSAMATCQQPVQLQSEKLHGVELIAAHGQAQQHHVQMIRHQAIRRTGQFLSRTGVQQNFSERAMKDFVKPAWACGHNSHGPVHSGKGLIVGALQPGKMMQVRVAHSADIILRRKESQPHSHEVQPQHRAVAAFVRTRLTGGCWPHSDDCSHGAATSSSASAGLANPRGRRAGAWR